ncbi:MAG: hypothetical protein IIW66_01215 [Bacteroidales bacterium]|nr:hypothetical protein [Bacteroidales bacterium]MBQ5863997.1 hypothetical protein [Bacteroidales bacterium]
MIKIIDNYRNLPVGKWLEILELSKDENVDALEQQVKTIAILTGLTEDEALDLPIMEYKSLAAKTKFLENEYDGKLQIAKSYGLNGMELIPVKDFNKITTAQYVDYQTFSKEGDMYLVQTLSTLLVPKGKKYNDGYDMDAVQEAIRENLSVADVLSLYAFFLTKWVKSIKDSQTYLDKEIKKIPNKLMREKLMKQVQEMRSKINGVG